VLGFCEHGNELPDSMKGGEFRDYLSDFKLLRDSAPRSWLVSDICNLQTGGRDLPVIHSFHELHAKNASNLVETDLL
jgi:hypothetical protein